MLVADFAFALPDDRIAQRPRARGESRLLVVDAPPDGRHRAVRDLPELLRAGDLLIVNDTRVLPARLFARRSGGGEVELLLAERLDARQWLCLVRPGRRARTGTRLVLGDRLGAQIVAETPDGKRQVRFDEPIEPHLDALGHVPLPPYIDRPDEAADRERYQTVWAREPGAIAAPTAGLHFDDALLAALEAAGVDRHAVTLHVGLGTFKPVTATLVHEHRMEAERWQVPEATAAAIAAARQEGRRVVAVGTTVVRTLESAARVGGGEVAAGAGSTDLFITPGFRFQVVDALLTNFHLPQSTLLMLVSAFAGRDRILAAYREAIDAGYLFYSYGDAMLVERGASQGPHSAPGAS